MLVRNICLLSCLLIVYSVTAVEYFDPDENELEDKEREISTLHQIDNPFPAIGGHRPWRSLDETRTKRSFCPRGYVHNPVTSGCLPTLSFLKGSRQKRVFCPRGYAHNPVTSGCVPTLSFINGKGRGYQR